MSLGDSLRKLNELDVNDLDFDNIGAWPLVVKVVACGLLFAAVASLGYSIHLNNLQGILRQVTQKERQLRDEFSAKAFQAANVEAYTQQMKDMEASFGALLRQLPSDTEVPGLLEDITFLGVGSGLEFDFIDLRPEVVNAFYVELPISISVKGGYHDIGSFVSGVANLSRIVTLHDFKLTPNGSGRNLTMQVLAKTYRYNDKGT